MSENRYEPYDFANRRHIGPSPEEMAAMLAALQCDTLDDLINQTVPEDIRQAKPLDFGKPLSERGALDRLREVANKNKVLTSLIGQGYHGTITPPAIQRNILENPAWYTAYTPYQPEISQGRLEALINYQTMVVDLTGLDVSNASLLDDETAAAEAMALCERASKSKAKAFFVDQDALPQTIALIHTRAEPLGWEVIVGDPRTDLDPAAVFGAPTCTSPFVRVTACRTRTTPSVRSRSRRRRPRRVVRRGSSQPLTTPSSTSKGRTRLPKPKKRTSIFLSISCLNRA